MALPATRHAPATERDLDDLPDDVVGHLVDGEIIALPRPATPHVVAATELGYSLGPPFRRGIGGPGGWVILDEPGVRFGLDNLVPDLAGWRKERFISPQEGPFTGIPDWICEVLSPSTWRFDRVTKLAIYARHEVAHVWLLEPHARTVEVLRLQEGRWLIAGVYQNQDKIRAEPFDAVELDLSLIWGEIPFPEADET